MKESKRICPNCGKELTKSARKCKYCNTSLIPIFERILRLTINILIILAAIVLIVFLLFKLIKIILFIFEHKPSAFFFDVLIPWLINSGIGPIIGSIFLSSILLLIFSPFWNDIKKETIATIKNISEDLASISKEEFIAKIKEDKKQRDMIIKEKKQNISKVVQKNGTFYIYNELGNLMHTTSHPFGVLTGYTSSSYTIKGNDGWTYVYDRKGHRTAY